MKRWALGLVLACGLTGAVQACGDDATVRHARDAEAGAGGNDTAGQGPSVPGEAGGTTVGGAGIGGAPADGTAGEPVMSSAGNPGAGGTTCDTFDDLLAPTKLCASLRTCYPDLQEADTQCVAPGDDDLIVSYGFFEFANYPNLAAIRACLCALPDQQPARDWVDCTLPADDAAGDCFSACPAMGNTCAAPFQTTAMGCNDQHHAGFVAVATCLAAK